MYAKYEFVHVFINGFSKCKISTIKEIFRRTGICIDPTLYMKFINDCLEACVWKYYQNTLADLIPKIYPYANFEFLKLTISNEPTLELEV